MIIFFNDFIWENCNLVRDCNIFGLKRFDDKVIMYVCQSFAHFK